PGPGGASAERARRRGGRATSASPLSPRWWSWSVPVGLRRGGLELGRGLLRVGRVAQEVLEDLPLAGALGAAEGGGRLVGHVEADRVAGLDQGLGGGPGDVVAVGGEVELLVR